jgi:hypothetical protein
MAEIDGVGDKPMADTASLWVSVAGLVVAAISLVVSIASWVVALGAKKQGKKTGTLGHRTEAIEHMRRAIADLANNAVVTPETLKRIRDARDLSEIVFSRRITKALDLVCRVISSPMAEIEGTTRGPYREGHNLDKTLGTVLAHMTKEAKLGS